MTFTGPSAELPKRLTTLRIVDFSGHVCENESKRTKAVREETPVVQQSVYCVYRNYLARSLYGGSGERWLRRSRVVGPSLVSRNFPGLHLPLQESVSVVWQKNSCERTIQFMIMVTRDPNW